jgi:hypothetical protein
MTNIEPTKPWSLEEEKILRHEAFIAELLKVRKPDDRKPPWQVFLESGAVAALVTVVLGGWIGHTLTASVQDKIKDRELALARHKEIAAGRLEATKRAFYLIGGVISASEDLLAMTDPAWDLKNVGEEFEQSKKQKEDFIKSFNASDKAWRKEREALGLLLSYYSADRPEIVRSWDNVEAAVDGYAECASKYYSKGSYGKPVPNICPKERAALSRTLRALTEQLRAGAEVRQTE